jgi:hypothetical protein
MIGWIDEITRVTDSRGQKNKTPGLVGALRGRCKPAEQHATPINKLAYQNRIVNVTVT